MDTVKALAKSDAVKGMKISNVQKPECEACVMGKICRVHHPERHNIKANENSAVLHIDTVGPMRTTSLGGARYFVLSVEEYSGYLYFDTFESKDQIPDGVKQIINKAELESGRPVKKIITDNGTEFKNTSLGNWLEKRGIIHDYSTAYTPKQNSRAERANRTILDGIRTLLRLKLVPYDGIHPHYAVAICHTTNNASIRCCLLYPFDEDFVLSKHLHVKWLQGSCCVFRDLQLKDAYLEKILRMLFTRMATPRIRQ